MARNSASEPVYHFETDSQVPASGGESIEPTVEKGVPPDSSGFEKLVNCCMILCFQCKPFCALQ